MQSTSIAMETDELRARVHGMWAAVAAGWGEHAEELDARGAIIAERLLDATRLQPGDRVLELARLLRDAGLVDVEVAELDVPLHVASFDAWWTRTTTIAGPLAKHVAALPPERTQAMRTRLREAVEPYTTADGLRFPGVTLIATAHVLTASCGSREGHRDPVRRYRARPRR
jgi:hypothetical protein